ncbi:MAG: hypothetical protein U0S50_12270 [Sphingopyxis sp.]|uniref:hypothetical protein n=1 Tax=Sphingopyxis sp. TaxID=1908224 RepID=UPI002ABCF158|nr:hypothetical protein [Sphingopyxis sp.]MDZ3832571.1 hypothetical protein [Sphingopyxis sp.]
MSLALAVALAMASAPSPCTPVPGAAQLWRQEMRWVVVGEMHGTNETPAAFANLACLAAGTGRPVVVAIEWSSDWQSAVDAYLASDGDEAARRDLLKLPHWRSDYQDGRASRAFMAMLERFRLMRRAGLVAGVSCFDVSGRAPHEGTRDFAMAQAWQSVAAPDDALILILVGNVHAMRRPFALTERTIETAGSLLPRARTMTVNVVGNGGTAWNCRADGCGVNGNGPPRSAAAGIRFSASSDDRWDAIYELGLPTTAAEPALDAGDAPPHRDAAGVSQDAR